MPKESGTGVGFALGSLGSARFAHSRFAFVTLATDDYFARGAIVALHSFALHARPARGSQDTDYIVLIGPPGISQRWRRRFAALGVRVVDVPEVKAGAVVRAAMETDRRQLAREGHLEMLQPVPYGGAFAKVHAWDPNIFGDYEKIVLLDGDVLAKRNVRGLLEMEPLAAGRDLMDALNYGVLVLRPDARVHRELLEILTNASEGDIARYNTRASHQIGFCDQTLVAGFLAEHYSPIQWFEDLRRASRVDPRGWLLSTEYNLVVSYRAKQRCEDQRERQRVDGARVVHFANNWLNFEALARDRDSPGRIDAPRCYRASFRYWHDVHQHALLLAEGRGAEMESEPRYELIAPEEDGADAEGVAAEAAVRRVFTDFFARSRGRRAEAAAREEL